MGAPTRLIVPQAIRGERGTVWLARYGRLVVEAATTSAAHSPQSASCPATSSTRLGGAASSITRAAHLSESVLVVVCTDHGEARWS